MKNATKKAAAKKKAAPKKKVSSQCVPSRDAYPGSLLGPEQSGPFLFSASFFKRGSFEGAGIERLLPSRTKASSIVVAPKRRRSAPDSASRRPE